APGPRPLRRRPRALPWLLPPRVPRSRQRRGRRARLPLRLRVVSPTVPRQLLPPIVAVLPPRTQRPRPFPPPPSQPTAREPQPIQRRRQGLHCWLPQRPHWILLAELRAPRSNFALTAGSFRPSFRRCPGFPSTA